MKFNVPYLFFFILLFGITAAFVGLISDYLMAVFWAVVLALLFHKLNRKIESRVNGKQNLAAALTLGIILMVVIIPCLLVGFAIVSEGIEIYHQIDSGELQPHVYWEFVQSRIPAVEEFLEQVGINTVDLHTNLSNGITALSQSVAGKLLSVSQNIASFLVLFFLMLYILFFFLRDGDDLVRALIWALPIGDQKEWKLLVRFEKVAKATVRGSLVIAILQGTLGGILFWAVGIPAAVLWGVLMTLLSLLPLGSGIVWAPAGVIFLIQGDYTSGLTVLLVGACFIGLLDNILRPRLVGSDTKMPDYLVLISTLGGLSWFGISGFILGPVITAFFLTCWELLGEEFNENHQNSHHQGASGPETD